VNVISVWLDFKALAHVCHCLASAYTNELTVFDQTKHFAVNADRDFA
jgi:hypothetical protein